MARAHTIGNEGEKNGSPLAGLSVRVCLCNELVACCLTLKTQFSICFSLCADNPLTFLILYNESSCPSRSQWTRARSRLLSPSRSLTHSPACFRDAAKATQLSCALQLTRHCATRSGVWSSGPQHPSTASGARDCVLDPRCTLASTHSHSCTRDSLAGVLRMRLIRVSVVRYLHSIHDAPSITRAKVWSARRVV